jgi:hypothetical protein
VSLGQMVPMVDDSWRVKFEQVRSDGFSRLRGWWVFTSIIAPILIHLLTVLCLPYVLACGIFPLFGYSLVVNSSVYRFAWLGSLLLGLWWYGTKRLYKWLLDLHNSIRDDRYLVGRQLHNFAERRRVGRLGKVPSTSIAVPDAVSKVLEGKSRDFAEYEAAGSGVSGKAAAMNENIIQGDSSEARVDTRILESGDRMGVGGSSSQLQHLVPGASI